jgi:hypothetical protein
MTIFRRVAPRDRNLLVAGSLTVLALLIPSPLPPALSSTMSILAGAIIGFLTSSYFSRKASSELQAAADKLSLIIRGLEEGGVTEFTYNEQGDPVGLHIKLEASSTGRSSASASAEVVRKEDAP